MKILITGDFVIDQSYSHTNISEGVKELFYSSDYNIVNLEAPLTNSVSKIVKTGPHLKANEESTNEVLRELKVNLVTLANNHILDYDEQGVLDTIKFCNENHIATVGAGKNSEEAAKILHLESLGGKISIISIAENEWASASETTAGANPMDLIENVKQIQVEKSISDIVIVIVHGGHEYYNLPSLRMQQQYRFYVDNGADIVVCHHTHCISGCEVYKGKPIYYSLGNFLFTRPSRYEDWYRGMVLEVEIEADLQIKTQPIFVKQSTQDFQLSLLDGNDLDEINARFHKYSNIIKENNELKRYWKNYVTQKSKLYDNYWSPLSFVKNKFIKKILTKLQIKGDNKSGKALFLNLMRCESHLDISKAVLNKKF